MLYSCWPCPCPAAGVVCVSAISLAFYVEHFTRNEFYHLPRAKRPYCSFSGACPYLAPETVNFLGSFSVAETNMLLFVYLLTTYLCASARLRRMRSDPFPPLDSCRTSSKLNMIRILLEIWNYLCDIISLRARVYVCVCGCVEFLTFCLHGKICYCHRSYGWGLVDQIKQDRMQQQRWKLCAHKMIHRVYRFRIRRHVIEFECVVGVVL